MDVLELVRKELLRRQYSKKTIKTYLFCLHTFFKHYSGEPRKVSKKDLNVYLDKLMDKNVAGSTINVHFNALKFFIEEILNKKRFFYNLKYSKTPKKLPTVLTKEEINRLVNVVDNKKHKLLIKLMYSAGLRVSELVNLRVNDLELEKGYGWVRGGKGNKDRMWRERAAFILGVPLGSHIKRMHFSGKFYYFCKLFYYRSGAYNEPFFLEIFSKVVIKFVSVTVTLRS